MNAIVKNNTSVACEWVENLPEEWEFRLMKRDFIVTLGKMLQSVQHNETETEEYYLRSANLRWEGVDITDIRRMWFAPQEKKKLALQYGDLLVSEGGDAGRTSFWKNELSNCYIQNAINRVRARKKDSTRFLYYWLYLIKSIGYIDAVVSRITIAHLTAEKLERIPFVKPPIPFQHRIASYLDKTCAAIDKAIEAKKKQLEILDALRKSIIHKAVTRGLDDSVELKDSGVEWLGMIPKHWFITKLKNKCQIIPSNVDKKSHDDETEVRLCNYVDVYYNEFIDDSIEYMVATANEHELKKFQLLEGDVLLTKDSEDPHDIAVPALVVRTQPKFLCGYHLSIIRSNNQKFNGSYLFWALKDVSIASQLYREATGITRWAIANRHVKNGTIPLPPDTEQKLIVSYLNKKCVELSRLHDNMEKQISTLQQYRKSLIHECVTGKRRITVDDVQDQL